VEGPLPGGGGGGGALKGESQKEVKAKEEFCLAKMESKERKIFKKGQHEGSVADPGSSALLTTGSGISFFRI
jgi:hypothetical protein